LDPDDDSKPASSLCSNPAVLIPLRRVPSFDDAYITEFLELLKREELKERKYTRRRRRRKEGRKEREREREKFNLSAFHFLPEPST
jgi:hypothetical protein